MRKSKPRNEGRHFRAWCGDDYVFAHNSEGKLCVKPREYNWWVMDSLTEMYHQFMLKIDEAIDVERGWQGVVRVMGMEDPQWRDYPEDGTLGRHHPDTERMRRYLKDISFHRRYSR